MLTASGCACHRPMEPTCELFRRRNQRRHQDASVGVQKLLEIMDLQGDIDSLLRDAHPSPFGSARWKDARPEELTRLVMMTAIQFVLFEPDDLVEGNRELKVAADQFLG